MMMTYDDGTDVAVGDEVLIDGDLTGSILTDIDARRGDDEWFYLETGLMIETIQAGLIHYGGRPTSLVRHASGRA